MPKTMTQDMKLEQLEEAIWQAFGECGDDVLTPYKVGNDYLAQLNEVIQCMKDVAQSGSPDALPRMIRLVEVSDMLMERCREVFTESTRKYAANLHKSGAMSADTFAQYK